mgnify:FL=1
MPHFLPAPPAAQVRMVNSPRPRPGGRALLHYAGGGVLSEVVLGPLAAMPAAPVEQAKAEAESAVSSARPARSGANATR